MGIEPTLSAWKAEVLPLNYTRLQKSDNNNLRFLSLVSCYYLTSEIMVEGEGFEPSKAEPSDLQSDPFGHSGTPPRYRGGILLEYDDDVN